MKPPDPRLIFMLKVLSSVDAMLWIVCIFWSLYRVPCERVRFISGVTGFFVWLVVGCGLPDVGLKQSPFIYTNDVNWLLVLSHCYGENDRHNEREMEIEKAIKYKNKVS